MQNNDAVVPGSHGQEPPVANSSRPAVRLFSKASVGGTCHALVVASHLHYVVDMKTSTLPAVRVEPALRCDAEAVLDEGESLSDFVASCVRDGIAWRRTQHSFLMRAQDAVERS